MAHHQDAIKRMKQNEKARIRNRTYRSRMRNQIKKVREAIAAGKQSDARTLFNEAMSVIHRVAQKGIIHRNGAARRISRLSKAVKKLQQGA